MRIAQPYEWKDPKPPRDAFDEVASTADPWFTDRDPVLQSWPDGRNWQPRPFTQEELGDYFDRGGVVTLKHPDEARRTRLEARQTERKDARAGITRQQRDWIHKFEPLAGVQEAVLVVKRELDLIKPTARKNVGKWSRIKAAIKAIGLDGMTQAEFAVAEKLDEGQLSRLLRAAYKRHPKLDRPLRLLNLLNQQTKRREVSTARVSCLKGGDEIGRCERAEVQQEPPYAEHHAAVKLSELEQEVFQPVQSNFPIMAAIETDEQISVGTQRVLWEMKRDDQGYEVGANDYKATLWHDNHEHEAIDRWRRLRSHVGLSNVAKLDLRRALRIAARFFKIEELRRATIEALPIRRELPTSATPYALHRCRMSPVYVDAPSRGGGYLGPVGREVRRPPTTWGDGVLHSYRMLAPPPKPHRRDGYARAAPSAIAVSARRLSPTTFIPQVHGEIFEARLASMLSSPLARDAGKRRAKQSKRWADDSIQRETTRFRPVKAPPLQPLGNERAFVPTVSTVSTQRSPNT